MVQDLEKHGFLTSVEAVIYVQLGNAIFCHQPTPSILQVENFLNQGLKEVVRALLLVCFLVGAI